MGRRVEAWTLELRTSIRIKSFNGGTATTDPVDTAVDVESLLLLDGDDDELWWAGVLGGEGRVLA